MSGVPDLIAEIIRAVTDVSGSLSLRQIDDILHERGIDICHETIRYGGINLGPCFRKM
jgi:transposase-like protein